MENYENPDHPFNGPKYRSGHICLEHGCQKPAGTAWSRMWCFEHNAERMRRISRGFEKLAAACFPGNGGAE